MTAQAREQNFFSGIPDLPPDMVAFVKHYLTLPGERGVPRLQTFLDAPPFSLMTRVAISDLPEGGDFKVRYFGTAMAEALGMDFTGMTAHEILPQSTVDPTALKRGRAAFDHPCGFLSRRLVYRHSRPGTLEAIFECLTVSLPIAPDNGLKSIVHYYNFPRLTSDQQAGAREPLGIKVVPVCWLDIGAGVPSVPV